VLHAYQAKSRQVLNNRAIAMAYAAVSITGGKLLHISKGLFMIEDAADKTGQDIIANESSAGRGMTLACRYS
jgi:hypothetical protein